MLVERMDRPGLHMTTPTLYGAVQIAKGLGIPLSKLVEGIEREVDP